MNRRTFLKKGLIFLATPAIINVNSLINVSVPVVPCAEILEQDSFEEFQKKILKNILSNMGIPFELLICGYDNTNYFAAGSAILEYKKIKKEG